MKEEREGGEGGNKKGRKRKKYEKCYYVYKVHILCVQSKLKIYRYSTLNKSNT